MKMQRRFRPGSGKRALDAKARAFLDEAAAQAPVSDPLDRIPAPALREMFNPPVREWERPLAPVARVEDLRIPGPAGEIPVRIYTPEGEPPFPALVYFHGGGWVLCDLDTHEGPCRDLANLAGSKVVAVDYRLAPEHRFPAAVEDCLAATRWVAREAAALGVDPLRVAAGGDSAGGNLAAVVAQLARDAGDPGLVLQLLVYPVTNYDFSTASYRENGENYFLTTEMMRVFFGHYLRTEADGADPRVSPLRAKDLSGLPPALVITAGYDPLRDEGAEYAARLAEAGVEVVHLDFEEMIHPFFSMTGVLEQALEARQAAGLRLRAAFERARA